MIESHEDPRTDGSSPDTPPTLQPDKPKRAIGTPGLLILLAAVLGLTLLAAIWPSETAAGSERNAGTTAGAKRFLPSEPSSVDPTLLADDAALRRASLNDLVALADPTRLGGYGQDESRALGAQIVRSSIREDMDPADVLAAVFPSPGETIAMLARDRDVDDFEESSAYPGAAGDRYQHIVDIVPLMRPLRTPFEALFAGALSELESWKLVLDPLQSGADAEKYEGGVTIPGMSTAPRRRDYELSHTYALDIFYTESEEDPLGSGETGPTVFSISDGIVVAAASDWNGGAGIEAYRSGGISPNAGNGAIIYNPVSRRFYLYFHMHDLIVRPGQALKRGQPIGRGGDSGANARKPGHGQHLHLEIYDARSARFLKNSEIADIVF
ncbi:MAG: M23 family metallopeptidase [Rectinema sp.]